jgi:hypothetical protein
MACAPVLCCCIPPARRGVAHQGSSLTPPPHCCLPCRLHPPSLMQARMDAARALFHDASRSQFIIVTIPTLMAAAESARLAGSLRSEGIPLETLVVNQVCVCVCVCVAHANVGHVRLRQQLTSVPHPPPTHTPWVRVVCSRWLLVRLEHSVFVAASLSGALVSSHALMLIARPCPTPTGHSRGGG